MSISGSTSDHDPPLADGLMCRSRTVASFPPATYPALAASLLSICSIGRDRGATPYVVTLTPGERAQSVPLPVIAPAD
jgi:hypothetical protein